MLNETDADNIPKLHRVANALIDKAIEGDVTAIKEVLDRVDGKVPQPIAAIQTTRSSSPQSSARS